ncbi:MATE family efflux transporter [Lachnospiraceae bacterium NSJ-143]|nr:MATE family efflux transporter [Lachnospiraceae bacterium NSJ-143]
MVREQSLTHGNVFKTLLGFSIPFLITNVFQALYGAADLFMVGRFTDSAGVSAVATGSQIMQTVTGLIVGMTTGGTVMIAQHFGAGRKKDMANTIATAVSIFGFLAIFLTSLIIIFLDFICAAMMVPDESYELTRQYLMICSTGIIFIFGFNTVSSVLRGIGDSKTPFYFIAIACFTNIMADYILVGIFDMGPQGAAVATVTAQALSMIMCFIYLNKKGHIYKFKTKKPSVGYIYSRGILSIGIPIAMQEMFVNISFLIITAVINSMGVTASAAVGVVEKLIMFSMLPTTAFASAVSAMTAQNIGAGLTDRAKKCMYSGVVLSLVFGIACYILAQVNTEIMISIFTSDKEVMYQGTLYLKSYSLDCIIVCFVFCMNTFFSGSGHAVFPLVHSIFATFLIRIPLSYILSRMPNASMFYIGFAAPLASFVSMLLCFWFFNRIYTRQHTYN